MDMPGLMQFK